MTLLILMALVVLVVVFAVFFLIFKLIWMICKKNTNRGPLLGAGVCTLLCALLMGSMLYMGYRAVLAPFQGIMANVKANPAPVYGERTYTDDTYPFTLHVYNGMDFSKWISLGDIQLKAGIDTNAFKKDAAGKKSTEDFSIALLLRQDNITGDPLESVQTQLASAQTSRQIEIKEASLTQINGMPAYQANGEAYSNRGKLNFWLTALQAQPHTVYYIGVLALNDTPEIAKQAQDMTHSFSLVSAAQ